jgi:hypothetical protein
MDNKEQYYALLTEIISKQAVILGPDIALLKAKSIPGLTVDDSGKVTEINGDPKEVVKSLVNVYVELSGMIVKSALSSVFTKYPTIEKLD